MKHIFLTSVAVVGLMFAGCAKKTPEVKVSEPVVVDTQTLLQAVQHNIQTVYFNFNKYNIRPDMKSVVYSDALLLNQNGVKNFKVKIEGNCDEWGTGEYNYALGLKRANTVKNAFIKLGVSPDRLSVVSYGKTNPVCTEKTKACDAKNRRDNFVISK